MTPRILVIDNDTEMLKLLQQHLEAEGFSVRAVATGADAITQLKHDDYDIVLTDLVMDQIDGLAVLAEARRLHPGIRVVVMTAFASVETAISAIRQGAYDYLSKPFKLPEVSLVLRRAIEDQKLREENQRLREE